MNYDSDVMLTWQTCARIFRVYLILSYCKHTNPAAQLLTKRLVYALIKSDARSSRVSSSVLPRELLSPRGGALISAPQHPNGRSGMQTNTAREKPASEEPREETLTYQQSTLTQEDMTTAKIFVNINKYVNGTRNQFT